MESRERIGELRGHSLPLLSLHVGQSKLITTSKDGTARLWDLTTGLPLRVLTESGQSGELIASRISPSGTLAIATSSTGTTTVWIADTGRSMASLAGHTSRVTAARFSPDESLLVTASMDETIQVWATKTWQLQATLQERHQGITALEFDLEGRSLLAGHQDGTLTIYRRDVLIPAPQALRLAKTRISRQLTPYEQRRFGTGLPWLPRVFAFN